MGYRMAGRSAATAAAANATAFGLWNPHATLRPRVVELGFVAQGAAPTAGNSLVLRRSTARGTVTSSVTPTIDNHEDRENIPPSGMTLDLTYSAQPTLATNVLWQWNLAAVVASGVMVPIGVLIPPGTGLVIAQIAATVTPALDVLVAWREAD